MAGNHFLRRLIHLYICAISFTAALSAPLKPFNCAGGPLYFVPHPSDGLVFQNPDLSHEFYVYKCLTTVFITSGDRGMVHNNYSFSREAGLKAAYTYLAGFADNETGWEETHVQFNGKVIMMDTLKTAPHIQNLWLRLPNGQSNGLGYAGNGMQSLIKLYNNNTQNITAIDGSAIYTRDSLMNTISSIIKRRQPSEVKVMNCKGALPQKDHNMYPFVDHADHTVSARFVVETMDRDAIHTPIVAYAGSVTAQLQATMNTTTVPESGMKESKNDYGIKESAFFKYAQYDPYMCNTTERCMSEMNNETHDYPVDDVKWVLQWLTRQYYIS